MRKEVFAKYAGGQSVGLMGLVGTQIYALITVTLLEGFVAFYVQGATVA